jgi:hypothetical protein
MGNFEPRWRSITRALLFSATAFLVCGAAFAQVNGFVVVNPIVVCDSNGAHCPPFGVLCSTNTKTGAYTCTQSTSPSTATVNTPIGFVDGDTNTNLTRAILAAQAGLDVAFFPVQQYNSPTTNTDPWPKISPGYSTSPTNYQHLHLKNVTCKDGTVITVSPDLAALTQHAICTEHGGVPTTVPKGTNPPSSPSPAPPLGSTLGESNALDLFIVTDFNQTVFGESWINGDGVSVAGPPTFLVTGPRLDNFDHEILHALALDHGGTAGAYGLTTTSVINLMTTGSSRFVPSSSGCSPGPPTGPATLGGGFSNLNGGELYDLQDPAVYPCSTIPNPPLMPAAEQLTQPSGSGSTCTLSTGSGPVCTDQVSALSLSPFINKTLAGTATAGGGTQAPVAGAADTTSSSSGVPFAISAAPLTGENGDAINSVIIALSSTSGLSFSGSSPATFVSCTDQNGNPCGVTIINQVRLNGNNGIGNPNCVKSINLAPPSVQCLQIFFSIGDSQGAAFVAGDTVTFNVAFNQDNATQLAGSQLTVITSTPNQPSCTNDPINCVAYATTTTFEVVGGVVQADSRFPDFTTPNQINPNFVNAAVRQLGKELSKCTPPYTGSGPNKQCPGGTLPKIDPCPLGTGVLINGMLYCND